MKTIKIKTLSLLNFRGVERMKVDFTDKTEIKGRNKTGKSTIKNAILWLLTNADEEDRINYKLFNDKIEQTKENSRTLEVEALFDVDGMEYSLKKKASVGWTRKKGRSEYERKGSDNYSFFVDGIERNATEYKNAVEELFCPIDKLKFILNTNYTLLLDWKQLRKELEGMIGTISEEDFTGNYDIIHDLLVKYNYDIETIKAYLKPRINDISKKVGKGERKGELEIILDTLIENLPPKEDYSEIERQIKEDEEQIKEIDEKISGSSKSIQPLIQERNKQIAELSDMRTKFAESEMEYKQRHQEKISELKKKIISVHDENYAISRNNATMKAEFDSIKDSIEKKNSTLDFLKAKREDLLKKNKECKEREFNGAFCPYCHQSLPPEKLDEERAKFEKEKEEQHQFIVKEGKWTKEEIEKCKKELSELGEKLAKGYKPVELKPVEILEAELSYLNDSFIPYDKTNEGKEKLSQIEEKEANIKDVPKVDNSALANMKTSLLEDIKELSAKLGERSSYEAQKKKIKDTQKELDDGITEQVRLEGQMDAVVKYDREKSRIIYDRVNGNFDYAKVEMTETNKSGELVDTCRILDEDGVDMRVTNTASKVRCGADISMAFAKYMGLNMPLILDNAEGVNKDNMPKTDSQIITLEVGDCDLTINNF